MHEQWRALEERCKACKACGLWETRTNVVFGDGNPRTDLMLIGEGPGQQEDLTGRAFVGRGGQLLDKFLAAVDLDRTKLYIGNMVKCRPPQNRDPKREETEQCIGFLREQVRIIRPRIIVCLGRIAACRLIDPNFKVTRQHGEWFEKGGIKFMGTFHPAALLRNPGQKPAAYEDFLKLRAELDRMAAEKNN